jgi:hypothetical protein
MTRLHGLGIHRPPYAGAHHQCTTSQWLAGRSCLGSATTCQPSNIRAQSGLLRLRATCLTRPASVTTDSEESPHLPVADGLPAHVTTERQSSRHASLAGWRYG